MTPERRKRILVVEDDAPLAELLKMNLALEGFEVATASKGADALQYATANPIDLVILDVRLPDMNGYEVAKELRKLHPPWVLPLMMLTGMDKPVDHLRGFAHGADAYLTKPCDPVELMQTIALLLGEPIRT